MDFFQSPNHTHTTQRHKKRLTQNQVRLLEISFNHDKKLDPERKFQLARDLGLPPRQVAIWYQNKRARWKTQTLELDYKAIQLRLESALADKRRLEKEVRRLNGELQKTHEMLLGLNTTVPSIHEDGNSSLQWEDNSQVLQVEALYACMMGVEDQTKKSNRPD